MAGKTTLFLLLSLVFIIPASFSQPPFPHIIGGFVFYDNVGMSGANVTITNERTGEILYNTTNKYGYFAVSLSDMPSGWKNGDKIKIVARKGNLIGEGIIIVDENKGLQEINITIRAPPPADFSYSPINPVANEKIKFYCLVDASFYQWNFDDGNISNSKNPEHVYKEPGNYSVTLMVKDKYGRVSTATKIVHVIPAASNQTQNINMVPEDKHENKGYIIIVGVLILFIALILIWKILK